MKTILSLLCVVALAASAFGQSGENLPTFKNVYSTATAPVSGTNEIQTLTFGATITSGTFKLKFDGETTAAITWSATNNTLVANIDAALEALNPIGTGGVTTAAGTIVAGVNGTVTVTFTGNRAKQNVPEITVANESLVGAASTLAVTTATPGVEGDGRILPKGSIVIALDTGISYQNTGSPPNPTWTKIGDQNTNNTELAAFAAAVPTAAVADLGAVTSAQLTGGEDPTEAEHNALQVDVAANRAKINDLLAKLRTAGILTP
ncbi:MAG TPA: hypothetical protein VF089_17885 [Candidatus Binatia bacterium]